MTQPLLSIVIPIHNERDLIEEVLRRVRAMEYTPKELVLVDDCSTDGTREILEKEKEKPNTIVLHHDRNRGKGAAIRTGLKRVSGEIVIIQDADLEYDPGEIPSVLEPILSGETEVSFGSRFMGEVKQMALPNRVANWILAITASILYGQKITDEATAYKAFRRHVLNEFRLDCHGFDFCPEVTAKVLRKGYRIKEIPVKFIARTYREGKKIGWRDFFQAMYILFKYRFGKIEGPEND